MSKPEQKDVQRAQDEAERERKGREESAEEPTRREDRRPPEPFSGSQR